MFSVRPSVSGRYLDPANTGLEPQLLDRTVSDDQVVAGVVVGHDERMYAAATDREGVMVVCTSVIRVPPPRM